MKRSTTLLLPVLLLVMASCGTPAQYSQQRFPDDVYAKIGEEPAVVRLYSEKDFEDMAAANIARKKGRDTLVVIIDDPWDYAWYSRYNHYHYYPWLWGGLGFSSLYWTRYYGSWYDPFWDGLLGFRYYPGGWYDPWYYSYYDPWYYDLWYNGYGYPYGYGMYGHRYGWYDHPSYPGGYWGGGYYRGRDVVRTPRSTTTVGGSRERRPGSGSNFRYGIAGSAGSANLRRGGNTRPSSGTRSSASSASGSSRSSSSYSAERRRAEGYNPSRSYGNNSSTRSSSSSSSSSTRSYSNSSSSSNSTRSYSNNSSSSTRSYSGGSSSSSRSSGGSYGGGGGSHSGSASHSGGGGSSRGGGRR